MDTKLIHFQWMKLLLLGIKMCEITFGAAQNGGVGWSTLDRGSRVVWIGLRCLACHLPAMWPRLVTWPAWALIFPLNNGTMIPP